MPPKNSNILKIPDNLKSGEYNGNPCPEQLQLKKCKTNIYLQFLMIFSSSPAAGGKEVILADSIATLSATALSKVAE